MTALRRVGSPNPAVAVRAHHQAEPADLVSIYAERLRASADAPPLFAPRPVARIGRGTPAFRRHQPTGRSSAAPVRLTRRGRLVAAAVAVAAVVTTALAGTVLAG